MFAEARADLARNEAASLRPVLEPGEAVLATGPVQAAFFGQDDIETPPGRIDEAIQAAVARLDDLPPVPKGFLAVAGVAAAVASPPSPFEIDTDRLLGGRVGSGGLGSVASSCKLALRDDRLTDLLVTDRRLAITAESDVHVPVEGTDRTVPVVDLLVSVPRSLVLGVRRRRRPLEWGRIELAFVDGSSITVTTGMISGRRATRFVQALTS